MFNKIAFYLTFFCFLSMFPFEVISQTVYSDNQILNQYIAEGIQNNLALKQKNFSYEQSMQDLNEARGLFLPSLDINARYSRAGGGRIIEFPVGDLMNGVYYTLNDMLELQGKGRPFPQNLQNEKINFLREEEHDTKIRAVQPVFNSDIYYNYKIKSNLKNSKSAEAAIYKRQLISEIKNAYYTYLKTVQVKILFKQTKELVQENVRVSRKLIEANKATKDILYRAETELYKIEQQQAEAHKNVKLASAYFNFLINKPLNDLIIFDELQPVKSLKEKNLQSAIARALEKREELSRLNSAARVTENMIGLSTGKNLPTLNLVFDYGFEGEKYHFTKDHDYWMGSAVLSWNIFNGFQDKAKREKAIIEKKKINSKLSEVHKQITLQVEEAYYNVELSAKKMKTAEQMVKSANATFKIVSKKYAQGMIPQIEYLDARTTMTNARINQLVSQYDSLIQVAIFERVTAGLAF